ncbi:MAG TPA: NAD-dependent epimerase/dehydratase family protein [Streptosporangiaceae bacterium]|nr:NAD-dependent epimerase/dehydratase family protein [Streptosporangiaceae bacterium]
MRHVVVGAGPIGSGVARTLAERGHQVTVVTRSGSGPQDVGIELVAADAADAEAIAKIADGAAAIYNCANPPYHKWPTMWPPIARSLLGAAERSGAVLVTISNLYGYGPARASLGVAGYDAEHPMTEATPLAATGKKGKVRAQMWRDALAAHEAGRIKAVEIRASDYVGPGANAVLGDRVVPRVLRGQPVSMIGRTDRLHTWSYTDDVVAMAALAGTDSRALGRVWHVPSTEPRTQRQAVDDIARAAGVKPVAVRTVPGAVLYGLGVVSPLMRELRETNYQFSEDFVMDSTAARQAFGLDPTPWDRVLTAVLSSYR